MKNSNKLTQWELTWRIKHTEDHIKGLQAEQQELKRGCQFWHMAELAIANHTDFLNKLNNMKKKLVESEVK